MSLRLHSMSALTVLSDDTDFLCAVDNLMFAGSHVAAAKQAIHNWHICEDMTDAVRPDPMDFHAVY